MGYYRVDCTLSFVARILKAVHCPPREVLEGRNSEKAPANFGIFCAVSPILGPSPALKQTQFFRAVSKSNLRCMEYPELDLIDQFFIPCRLLVNG